MANYLNEGCRSAPKVSSHIPLDVLHHGVLSGELVVVGEVVDELEIVHSVQQKEFFLVFTVLDFF